MIEISGNAPAKGLVLALGLLAAMPAWSQDAAWPGKAVKIVLPLPAGTANDIATRALAQRLAERWGQAVVVENKPGASTIIGVTAVAKAASDGYTLLSATSQMTQNVTLRRSLPYDMKRELVPIAQIYQTNLGIFAHVAVPANNLTELIAYAKAHPGKLNFGSWGEGSTGHLVLETMQRQLGLKMAHIPYKGGPDALNALRAREIDVTVSNMLGSTQHVRVGEFKLIGITGTQRVPEFPQAQTLAEVGVDGFEGANWQGLFAPAGTPDAIVKKLTKDAREILTDKEFAAKLNKQLEIDVTGTAGDDFVRIIDRDLATWKKVITAAGTVLD